MVLIKNIPSCPSTTRVFGLSKQVINEFQSGLLLDCSDLNISIDSLQFPLLQSPAKDALRRAINNRGRRMEITSAYRTCVQQFLLRVLDDRGCQGIFFPAPPGRSNHESGLALDIVNPRGWEPFLMAQGWLPLPGDDPHFDFFGSGTQSIGGQGVLAFQRLWNRNNQNDQIDEDGLFGNDTARRMLNSPAEGFNIDEVHPILRLTTPLIQNGAARRVQLRLIELGFLAGTGQATADGIYGPTTEEAVRLFQIDRGITVDGIVGSQTYEALGIN